MNDERRIRRVQRLLEINQSRENAAKLEFDTAAATAEEVSTRIAQCEREVIARHERARERMLSGGLVALAQPYRDDAAAMRRKISHLVAKRKVAESVVEDRRVELIEAMTRRLAAEILQQRLADRQAVNEARQETRRMDESHAAVVAADRALRQDEEYLERQPT